ncbi:MAG: NAD(P)-binding domain-containing protein [Myxococcaceae bacterium]
MSGRFVCHLSTVSNRFAHEATRYCESLGVDYVNYPLTGGPAGAEKATMLILCGGAQAVFERLRPALALLGRPQFFGPRVDAGADVKFIGHLMVFNGLVGVASAVALHSECFREGQVGGAAQAEFFDFLNQGAGGTRQWDVGAARGIRDGIWDSGFPARYALVDAIYTAERCLDAGVSRFAVDAVLRVARGLARLVALRGSDIATHGLARELVSNGGLAAVKEGGTLDEVVAELEPSVRAQVHLNASAEAFG